MITAGAIIRVLVAFILCVGAATASEPTPKLLPPHEFKVFDGTLYRGKPDMTRYGIEPIEVLYVSRFFHNVPAAYTQQQLPDRRIVRRVAREASALKRPVIIDIEHWSLTGSDSSMRSNMAKHITVLQWLRNEAPDLNLGYFAILPEPAYGWALKSPGSREYDLWSADNERRSDLAPLVDAVYPAVYTYFPDRDAWVRYAIANLTEARRYGKPVYAFLWPQYSEANKDIGLQFLPADYWRLQLETVRKYADGIAIWGGWGGVGPAVWDDNAPWWQVTRDFMHDLRGKNGVSQHNK